ncbi:uncharacterized protein LOC125309178 isoform X1 [Alosa alosa]|uniref:uncharacterized protein LOC125309178 isoform X1 n=2 Tax=Alosa alosa TaxID=278164 RepID=UPI002015535E|nr:uncharacterized protein LOC125309178 isoform X1 [Alosa alosa]
MSHVCVCTYTYNFYHDFNFPSGINSISTVKKVTVRKGETIIIPCHYREAYRSNNKIFYGYWDRWHFIVNSKYMSRLERVSISDDPDQTVFTVTMKNMGATDEGLYQCDIENNSYGNEYQNVYILVEDFPTLYVHSQVETGYVDGGVTINCYYSNYGVRKWCRIDGRCVYQSYRYSDGMRVDTSTDANKGVFKVIMRGLQLKHTGWYYCSVGDLQMPVHITVKQNTYTQRTITQQPAIKTTIIRTTITGIDKFNLTKVDDLSSTSTTNKTNTPNGFSLTLLLGLLGLLLLVVICGTLTLIRLKKRRRDAGPDEAFSQRKTTATLQNSQEDTEVTYSMIAMTPSKNAADDTHGDVTYSTVVTHNRGLRKSLRYQVADVIYSEVATK